MHFDFKKSFYFLFLMTHFQKVTSKNDFISITKKKKKKNSEKRLDEKRKKDVQVCRVELYKFEHKLHALHLTN